MTRVIRDTNFFLYNSLICQYTAAEETIDVPVSNSESEEERKPIDIVVMKGQFVLVEPLKKKNILYGYDHARHSQKDR